MDVVLDQAQHRPDPFARGGDDQPGLGQGADLTAQPLDPSPAGLQLDAHLAGLLHRGIPISGQDLHLGIQTPQIGLDRVRVVTPTDHRETRHSPRLQRPPSGRRC